MVFATPLTRAWLRIVTLVVAFVLAGPAAARDAAPTGSHLHFAIGDTRTERPARTSPGLMLMGGSDWVKPAFQWFSRQAGNGNIVILRASGKDDLQKRWYEDIGGVASVQTIVFNDRTAAADPRVLDVVAKADGIFIAGGDQSRYIRYWKGTPLNRLLDEHVRNGKPLGGTSAGLAILGHASYGALDGRSLISPHALADPLGASVTLDSGFLDLPFLDDVVTDTHFFERNRFGRLITFLVRARHEGRIADPLGIGVDENTMLCIEADGRARVFSADNGHAWFIRLPRTMPPLRTGVALDLDGIRIIAAGSASHIHMRPLSISPPALETTASVHDGVLEFDPALPFPLPTPTSDPP